MKLRLRELRMHQGFTLAHVGELVGKAACTVCGYENGHIDPPLSTALRLAEVLGVSLDDLVMPTTVEVGESIAAI